MVSTVPRDGFSRANIGIVSLMAVDSMLIIRLIVVPNMNQAEEILWAAEM